MSIVILIAHIIILVIKMRIRLLKKNEIKEVSKLLVTAYENEDKDRRWNEKCAEDYVQMMYKICNKLCFVAVEEGKIVGVTLNIIMPDFCKEIVESRVLLVHPDFRRQKIGTKLITKVCEKALNDFNIEEIESSIYTLTNFPITWYECIGFRTKKYYEVTRANIANVLNKM